MKKINLLFSIFLVTILMAGVVSAGQQAQEHGAIFQLWDIFGTAEMNGEPVGQSGHLWLFSKDPITWAFNLEVNDPWGRLVFFNNEHPADDCAPKDAFVFNAAGLNADTDYTLIYYPDINKMTLNFECIGGCSGTYSHTMVIDTADKDGFSGTGYYNSNPSYTWDVTGTSKDTFTITYTGLNPGYTVTCEEADCTSSSGQTFSLEVFDTGNAVWPHPIKTIESGETNEFGNVYFSGNFDFSSIPWTIDFNEGAKIWLVLSDDIDGVKLSGWNPTEYLFEEDLI